MLEAIRMALTKTIFVVSVVLAVNFNIVLSQTICKTPGNRDGICVTLPQCPYLEGLTTSVPVTSQAEAFVKLHHCNETSSGVLLVCCADGAVNKTEADIAGENPSGTGDTLASRFQFPSYYNNQNSLPYNNQNSAPYNNQNSVPFNYNFNPFQGNQFGSPFPNLFGGFSPFGYPGINGGGQQQPVAPPPQQFQPEQPSRPAPVGPPASSNMRQVPNNNGLNLLPSRVQCGTEILGNRILNGEDAEENEFPWVALLEYRKYDNSLTIACAGSLINEQYVLTASHCVVGKILKAVGQLANVRLGDWDVNVDTGGQRYNEVDEIIPHEEYADGQVNHSNDIALIRLKRKVRYSDKIRPICLPDGPTALRSGEQLYAAGFGRTLEAAKSAIKQKIVLPVFDQNRCRSKFIDKRVEITNNHLCAGGEVNRDTCDGDSGGPLMKFKNNWILEGITSFGDSRCGREDLPGVYTRVSSYIPWIKQHMRQ